MSGDPEQQYFSDGIREDIITELSRFHQLSVLARNASSQYRKRAIDVKWVGRKLGVQYVVEGSVRRLGDRIRVTAQLADAISGNHLWGERYDRDQQDIFAVQDQIVRTIVGTLAGRLEAAGAEQAKRKLPNSLAAYDYVLRGNALPVGDVVAEAEATRMFRKAIEIDPTYGRAHALLSHALSIEWFHDMTGSDALLDLALEHAKKGVELDEIDSLNWMMLAWIHLNRKSFDLAERYYQRAVAMNPNNPWPVTCMGTLLNYSGKPEEGIEWFNRAKVLDPYFDPPWWWHMLGVAHFNARQHDKAIAAFMRSPTNPVWVRAYLAACHALTDRKDRAKEFAAEVIRREPNFTQARYIVKEPFKRAADRQHLLDGMHKAGLPE